MNHLHLIWIIPLAASFGFMVAAILSASKETKGEPKMAVIYVRNEKGEFVEVPALVGRSAYEIAVASGFKGTEAEWLASLKPKKGVDYFTAADKQEIINAVLAQLPSSGGGSGGSSSGSDSITFTVGGISYTVPAGTTWSSFVANGKYSYWADGILYFTIQDNGSDTYVIAENLDTDESGAVLYGGAPVIGNNLIEAKSYDIENTGS